MTFFYLLKRMFQRIKRNFQKSLCLPCISIRLPGLTSTFGKTGFMLDDSLPQPIKDGCSFIIHNGHFKVLHALLGPTTAICMSDAERRLGGTERIAVFSRVHSSVRRHFATPLEQNLWRNFLKTGRAVNLTRGFLTFPLRNLHYESIWYNACYHQSTGTKQELASPRKPNEGHHRRPNGNDRIRRVRCPCLASRGGHSETQVRGVSC